MNPDALERGTVTGETTILQHGTCRFGKDPSTSVLDPDCRAHEVSNLYVVDGSFMPSSGGIPTTLTIAANAFRVGHGLVKRLAQAPEKL
jgi:choline dehydrogenase-like flavoprotein